MRRPRSPLAARLRDDVVDEVALARIWQGVDARLPEGGRRRARAGRAALGAGAALAVVGALAIVVARGRDAGPLRLADGAPLAAALVAPEAETAASSPSPSPSSPSPLAVALADGSRIELAPGARLEPLESSGSAFMAVLARGSATFDVRPGGPRRWTIECGLATVEVVGTRFGCARAPGRLRVTVARGSVLVRGERVPDRARRLGAGEALDVVEQPAAVAPPPPALAPAAAAQAEPPTPVAGTAVAAPVALPPARAEAAPAPARAAPVGRAGVSSSPGGASWRELARGGRSGEAFAALGPGGIRRESRRLGVGDLLALADVARLSGHPDDAVAPLERILAEFADSAEAPLAALALGRIELDALGRPARAAAAFERALALGAPRSLREDLTARLCEARARAGDGAGARAAAAAYFRDYPRGRYAHAIRAWLEDVSAE